MILEAHKKDVMTCIEQANSDGARYSKACEVVGISLRTLQRWKREGLADRRKGSKKKVVRKLSPDSRVRDLFYYAFVVTDISDKSIVGWSVHEQESESHSRSLFARVLRGRPIRLKAVHADNGHPMKGIMLMAFLQSLKVSVSHNRPRTINNNPFIESQFKTLKYHVTYPEAFASMDDASWWMGDFVYWYNTQHMHSSIGYVTPHQMRTGQA